MSNKNNNKDSIENIIETTFSHIKDIVDANTIVGNPIELTPGFFTLPVSKISVGLITGGGSMPKSKNNDFNAGSGTGFNIEPVGFVTISDDIVNFLPVEIDNFERNLVELLLKFYDNFANKEETKNENKK